MMRAGNEPDKSIDIYLNGDYTVNNSDPNNHIVRGKVCLKAEEVSDRLVMDHDIGKNDFMQYINSIDDF